jgi:hypothetical protein
MQECVTAVGYRGAPNKLVLDFISAARNVSKVGDKIVARSPIST